MGVADDVQLLRPLALRERLVEEMRDWCAGRSWLVRVPLLLYLAYIFVRQIENSEYSSLFGALNLGIHEGGHLLFRSGGQFLHIAGGTFLQLLAPAASMVMFYRQRDYFAIAVCLGWLSTNFVNIGVYMADAEKMELPLVTVGDAAFVIHDWRFLLSKFGLLRQCEALGGLTRLAGHLCMAGGLALAIWLLLQMYRRPVKSSQRMRQ